MKIKKAVSAVKGFWEEQDIFNKLYEKGILKTFVVVVLLMITQFLLHKLQVHNISNLGKIYQSRDLSKNYNFWLSIYTSIYGIAKCSGL